MSAPKKGVALRWVHRMWAVDCSNGTFVHKFKKNAAEDAADERIYYKGNHKAEAYPVAVISLRLEAVEKAVDRIRKAIEQRPRPNYSLDLAKETYKQMMDRNKKIERDGARAVLSALVGRLPK